MSLIHWATLAAACVQRETWCIFTRKLKKVDCQVLFSVLVGKWRLLTEQMCVKAWFLNKVTEGNKHPFGSVCGHSASGREALANKSAQSGRLCPAVCSTASTKTTEWPRAQGCDNMNDSANNPYSKLQWNGAIIKRKWIVKYCGVVLSLSVPFKLGDGKRKATMAVISSEICESCNKREDYSPESKKTWFISSKMNFHPLLWQTFKREHKNSKNLITWTVAELWNDSHWMPNMTVFGFVRF